MRRAMLTLGVLVVFTGLAVAAPVPKSIKANPVVRKTIPPRWGEKVYSVDWVDVPCEKAMDELEHLTGLLFLSKDVPKVNITLKADKVCVAELFALVNDELVWKGYALGRKSQSFNVFQTDAPLDRIWCPHVTLEDLARRGPEEPVQFLLGVGEEGVEAGKKLARTVEHKWFAAESFGSDKLLVRGRVKDVGQFKDGMKEYTDKVEAEEANKPPPIPGRRVVPKGW